ncbi:MAG TPA: diacylglycerol kinase family protein [Candidatus Binatia bacterium]|nr:diacylglycerol kinase family protein [Candidatus Binatia bacterium]
MNRTAGRGSDPGWEDAVAAILGRRLHPTFVHPADGDDAARVALAHARAGAAAVVIAGGDGTVHRVVNAVAATGTPIALLPRGTANDLARALGIPTSVETAARRILDGYVRAVDLIEVDGRAVATVGGLGLPASCALAVRDLKQASPLARTALGALGTSVYPLVAAGTVVLRAGDVPRVRMTLREPGGRRLVVEQACHGLLVANQDTLGGGLVLPTRSRNDDGVLELALLSPNGRAHLLATLAALRLGRPVSRRAVGVWRAIEATLECERPLPFFGDGEPLDPARKYTVRVRPGALRVVC